MSTNHAIEEEKTPHIGDAPSTCEEVAALLKLKPTTVNTWARTGKIRSVKFGKRTRIPAEEVRRILGEGV